MVCFTKIRYTRMIQLIHKNKLMVIFNMSRPQHMLHQKVLCWWVDNPYNDLLIRSPLKARSPALVQVPPKNAFKLSTMVGANCEIYLSQMAKMHLNFSPWLEKILKFTYPKCLKMHLNLKLGRNSS